MFREVRVAEWHLHIERMEQVELDLSWTGAGHGHQA